MSPPFFSSATIWLWVSSVAYFNAYSIDSNYLIWESLSFLTLTYAEEAAGACAGFTGSTLSRWTFYGVE